MKWPMCCHVERQASRMHDMMERLDVDPAKLARLEGGEAYAKARLNCLRCPNARECLFWLETEPQSGERPLFCQNLALFEACKKEAEPALAQGPDAESQDARPAKT